MSMSGDEEVKKLITKAKAVFTILVREGGDYGGVFLLPKNDSLGV